MTPRIPYVDLVAQHRALKPELHAALERVLDHGQFILGPEVAELERALATSLGVSHVVGVSNGTDALVLGLKLAGVSAGDEVITVSHSFVATATAIRLVGASPVFVEIDEATMNIDPAAVERAWTPRTRAVMPVHLNGSPAPVDRLEALCRARGAALVEDCAQAIGARLGGRSVGSFGIGCFSLHPLKVLSAVGDAGFVTVATEAEAITLRRMRNLGLRDRDHCQSPDGNMRLDTLQAALLLVKLGHLPGWIAQRRAHAKAYREHLGEGVQLGHELPSSEPVHSAFVIRHPRRDELQRFLAERGIDTKVHYPIPIHRQEAFAAASVELPVTDRVCAQILSLPVTPELSVEGRARVIEAVRAFGAPR